ncbi:conserved protein of unknown function [Cupriavidus neocaledonicus]|uniref:Uncharacterized protein n=2 Tax=Cupriavidus neocaledonicus TaxID=1040979 RepID=A0A375H978_9BURK|nr:hypothetical protein CBM2605_B100358 [Cupriavidus neocaledonicus]SPD46750.1 conserved protein of unknown function [Cupriavidus neocaledonicus]
MVTLLFILNCGASLAASHEWLHHEMEHALEAAGMDSHAAEEFIMAVAEPEHDDDSGIPHGALHAFAQLPATLGSGLTVPIPLIARSGPLPERFHLLADHPDSQPFKPPRA